MSCNDPYNLPHGPSCPPFAWRPARLEGRRGAREPHQVGALTLCWQGDLGLKTVPFKDLMKWHTRENSMNDKGLANKDGAVREAALPVFPSLR